MTITINTAEKYIPLLDEVYKNASKTAIIDSDSSLMREGANASEIIIPSYIMDGLGDYDRDNGYVNGSVTLT